MGEVLERDPAELEVTIGVVRVPARPLEDRRGIASELGAEGRGPVVMPREDECGKRVGVSANRMGRDRLASCRGELSRGGWLSAALGRKRQATVAQDLPSITHPPNVTTVTTARFDRTRIQAFLQLAGERLEGEWLLIGGGAAAAWFAPTRTTEDVDLISLAGTQADRLALMELAAGASLPIEAVNSAADYFVRKIDDWRDHLVVLHRGTSATIYRPDSTLFLLLKVRRLSETDLDDCIALIDHCARRGEPTDTARLRMQVEALPPTEDRSLHERRARLLDHLV